MSKLDSNSRSIAHEIMDWVINYRENIESFSVFPNIKPGKILEQIPKFPNSMPHSLDEIFSDFKSKILSGITHWQHPKFFGYFPANSSVPSLFAEILVATLGVQCMSWITSPAATELEMRMMEWLKFLFDIPEEYSGVIQDSGSISTLIAVICAREASTQFQVNEFGTYSKRLVAYCSVEAHSSIEKAIKIAGIGRNNLRRIPVNPNQQIRLDLLRQAILNDLNEGHLPFLIVGAFGTTGTTAFDNLEQLASIAKEFGLWFHVDAAFAGAFLALPEFRPLAKGIEQSDSIVINPHKGLFTTFECSTYFVKNRDLLLKTFEILPEYLKTSQFDSITNYRDWGIGLGRRFRALKLWFVMRSFGTEGLQNKLRFHLELAKKLESWIFQEKDFELTAKVNLNLICFRYKPDHLTDLEDLNQLNLQLLELLNSSGKLFLTHTKIENQVMLRILIGQTDVQEFHIQQAWLDIQEAARSLLQIQKNMNILRSA